MYFSESTPPQEQHVERKIGDYSFQGQGMDAAMLNLRG